MIGVHAYEPGDESRLIDWKTSARQGRPMVVERERLSTSRVWLLMDVGLEMTGVCPSGERAWQVAANALRMFAALSLRRSDDISLVFGDESSITRVPFNGGFAQFERTLDKALDRDWDHHRNIDALLEYARRIKDREALIVLATDEHAIPRPSSEPDLPAHAEPDPGAERRAAQADERQKGQGSCQPQPQKGPGRGEPGAPCCRKAPDQGGLLTKQKGIPHDLQQS